MADLSIAVIVGRVVRNAELKYTSGGSPICSFAVATSTRKKKGDQWVDEASFWDVELWGKQGESLNQYLTKGKQVAIEGTMRQDRWEKDGQQKMKVIINAQTVQLLGGGQDVRNTPHTPDRPQERSQARAPSADGFEDSIPF